MERRINKRIESYISTFKDNIRDKVTTIGITPEHSNPLLQYIYDYERLAIGKDDLLKRKRVKNVVPFFDRCCAKRANGEQCTRKRKDGCEFCGTHAKGVPYGLSAEECAVCTKQIDVFATDIMGIVYYIDKFNNVYKTEDILEKKTDPAIIAKCKKINGVMCIPEFGLC